MSQLTITLSLQDIGQIVGYHLGAFCIGWAAGRALLAFRQFMDSAS